MELGFSFGFAAGFSPGLTRGTFGFLIGAMFLLFSIACHWNFLWSFLNDSLMMVIVVACNNIACAVFAV